MIQTELIRTDINSIDFKEVYAIHDIENERLIITGIYYNYSITFHTANLRQDIEQSMRYENYTYKDDLLKVIDNVVHVMELCPACNERK